MKQDNLELALREYNPSVGNDKITYEKHYYNGFAGIEGDEAYYKHLETLYNAYFVDFRGKIDNLVMKDANTLRSFLQNKIDLFNNIADDFKNKNQLGSWKGLIRRDETVDKPTLQRSPGARNEYYTMKFFVEMINVQNYFIDKAITELTGIYNNFNPNQQPQTITEEGINKEEWDNALKDYPNDMTTQDVAKAFAKSERTINLWKKQGMITPYHEGHPDIYTKEEIKKYIFRDKNRKKYRNLFN